MKNKTKKKIRLLEDEKYSLEETLTLSTGLSRTERQAFARRLLVVTRQLESMEASNNEVSS